MLHNPHTMQTLSFQEGLPLTDCECVGSKKCQALYVFIIALILLELKKYLKYPYKFRFMNYEAIFYEIYIYI